MRFRRLPIFGTFFALLAAASLGLTACNGGAGALSSMPNVSTAGSSVNEPIAGPMSQDTSAASNAVAPASTFERAATLAAGSSVAPESSSAYSATVLNDHPQAYYGLGDSSLVLTDLGPNHLNGSYGTSLVRRTAAITAGASAATGFPGSTTYNAQMFTTTPPNTRLQPTLVSLEAWIKVGPHFNTTGKPLMIASYGRYANGARYGLFVSQQNVLFYTQHNIGTAAVNVFGNSQLSPGGTYHCVATSDGRSLRLFVNGVLENTVAYAGKPDYVNAGNEGLYIGGAFASSLPSFNGTIAQVAVYSQALSASTVMSHFVSGVLVPMVTEAAVRSDHFVESLGINTHFTDYASIYGIHYSQAKAALLNLGIRHIRDGLFTQKNTQQVAQYHDLGAAGIGGLFTTALPQTKSAIQGFPSLVGNMFEAYEAPNEQDDVDNPNWLADCKTFQRNLYAWVKNNAATQNYPVIGPSIVSGVDYPKVGNLSAYMDYANIHDYMNPRNPGTAGWGSLTQFGEYGSISYNMNLASQTSGDRPVIATETGYGTIPGNPLTLDYRAQLRYIPRLLFEQYNHGIHRSFLYELLDKGGSHYWNNFGLVQTNFAPKPAYTALRSIIGALSERGSTFTPNPLTYQIAGNLNNVHHTLMEKSNGSYVVAVWIETLSWDFSGTGSDVNVPAQTISVTTLRAFSGAKLSTLDEGGNMSTASLSWSGHSASFPVTDKVTLLTIAP